MTHGNQLSLEQIVAALSSGTQAIVPGWMVPAEPRRLVLLRDDTRFLLVEWDSARECVCSASAYSPDEFAAWLPKHLRGSTIFATAIPLEELPAALPKRAGDFLVQRDGIEAQLRSEPQSWARFDHGQRALFRANVACSEDGRGGFRWVHTDAGGHVQHYAPCDDFRLQCELNGLLSRDGAVAMEPVPDEITAILDAGDDAYAAFQAQMRRGELGWNIHSGLTVVRLPTGYYNTAFAGDAATRYTRLIPLGEISQEAEMLTAATLAQLGKRTRALTPGQFESLSALVARNESTPEQVFAQLEAGAIELCGGGPTSEDIWSIAYESGRFVQRLPGTSEVRDREDVRALVAARRYHTFRRLLG